MDDKIIVENEQKKKKTKNRLSYYFTAGIIFGLIDKLADAVYNLLANGFFGTIFTAYSSEQRLLESGYLHGYMFGSGTLGRYSRSIRRVLSEQFENGYFLWLVNKINKILLGTPLKIYGNYFLTFGLYTVFAYFVRRVTAFGAEPEADMIVFGVVAVLASMPLLLSKESLASAIGSSRSARALFCGVFGFREECFEVEAKPTRMRANVAIVLGMVSGFLTFIIEPIHLIALLLGIVIISLVIATPEIGVVLTLFSLPFLSFTDSPSFSLAIFVVITAAGYVIKLIRGKRLIKFEIVDILILVFMIMLFLSGVISVGGDASKAEVLLSCTLMLVYFLVANMMRTEAWIRRCVVALVSSAAVVSVIGIVEYFFGTLTTEWLDITYFADIKGRVVSLFDNSNVLAFYLAIIFPFALDTVFRCKTRREKFISSFATAAIFLCVVFTFSRGAWVAILITGFLYLFIRSRKALKALFAFCLAIPILPVVIPSNIMNRFLSIGDMSDSSTFYRVYTWKGATRAALDNFLGGVGYGNAAFSTIYPQYAYAGIEAAEHSHSLFLQIWIGMGIVGLLVFGLVIFFVSQKNFEYFRDPESHVSACTAGAAFSAFAAAMVMGLFDHIWYNYRVFFLFWAVVGISTAIIRVGNTKSKRSVVETVNDQNSAEIEIY